MSFLVNPRLTARTARLRRVTMDFPWSDSKNLGICTSHVVLQGAPLGERGGRGSESRVGAHHL
ncbi:unnamed protein product [Mycena citricolor]|uniref:Uncharacterized protein n=1 Tax=Mycena citricolor TaxID=2018698 RepID=A0AAD2GVD6_9AGAR|nr:unnamed protein product [Mycena citricolor]